MMIRRDELPLPPGEGRGEGIKKRTLSSQIPLTLTLSRRARGHKRRFPHSAIALGLSEEGSGLVFFFCLSSSWWKKTKVFIIEAFFVFTGLMPATAFTRPDVAATC